jgi:hypothetical protein
VSFVRVRLPNGYETSVSEVHAQSEGLEILDAPATNLRGKPLPATRKNGRPKKKRTSVAQAAAKKAAAVPSEVTAGGDAEGGKTE